MKKILYILIAALLFASCSKKTLPPTPTIPDITLNGEMPELPQLSRDLKKKEFRGVWIQTAWQDRYQKMTPAQCQKYLTNLVETLYRTGFNAIIFQVRPEGDAFYESEYEPWSRFLTGKQGKSPNPAWDPMAFLIKLCHERKMEFHAWLNPYRMWMSKGLAALDSQHLYRKYPEWFVTFDDKLYLNPGLPESRQFIRAIVSDIVTRYDVDAIHIDDYFYPYPVKGKTFNDMKAFNTYAKQMNIDTNRKDALAAFRRRSVDILIKSIHEDIKKIRPKVKFGISPFGIYRNKSSWEGGSETSSTQCYDDLYADVLFWARCGWIDYVIPQIYWEIGHIQADYCTLVEWWNDNIPKNCALYIGQSIERSLDGAANDPTTPRLTESCRNISAKLNQAAKAKNVKGNCFWYAYQIEDNQFGIRDYLYEIFNRRQRKH